MSLSSIQWLGAAMRFKCFFGPLAYKKKKRREGKGQTRNITEEDERGNPWDPHTRRGKSSRHNKGKTREQCGEGVRATSWER